MAVAVVVGSAAVAEGGAAVAQMLADFRAGHPCRSAMPARRCCPRSVDQAGQGLNRGVFKQADHGDMHSVGETSPDLGQNPQQQERVAAQIEEIVMQTDLRILQDCPPDLSHRLFGRSAGRGSDRCPLMGARASGRHPIGWRQGGAVHLAATGQG